MDDDAKIQDHSDSTTAGDGDAANGDAANGDAANATAPAQPEIPDRLRVHSLARVLGTTSRRVLEALAEFDGRSRSAHSSVDRVDAVKVRDVLAAAELAAATPAPPEAAPAPVETPPVAEDTPAPEIQVVNTPAIDTPAVDDLLVVEDILAVEETPLLEDAEDTPEGEPESRLLIEMPPQEPASESDSPVADYLPLFVAPQPVKEQRRQRREPQPEPESDEQDADDSDDGDDTDDEQAEKPANRRRRRGRRGRGRGRGGEAGSDDGDDDSDDAADTDSTDADSGDKGDRDNSDRDKSETADSEGDSSDEDDDDDNGGGDGSSRRRRRRRRRKSGAAEDGDPASADDPPNTVVHERAPRSKAEKADKSNEIQGISGSTRLEAKRQRRRDGRDAGRRRPPILSEAEFLARREAVERVMVVRDTVRSEPPHSGARYTQIAVLEDGVVVEHFVTSASSASLVGNIYLGIVQNVLPSMEAAFVDIGRGRNGVLYAGEVNWEAAGLGGAQRKIEQALKPGDYVVVQVSKDPVGHKGARLTTQVSLAGRYLVYVPGASSTGISRKLPDTERQRLKEILREVVPADAGVIIRTASEGVKEEDIRGDVTRLQERWNQIDAKAAETKQKASGAAVALYEEPDVLVKVIRDLFNEDFSNLIVAGDTAWKTINDYVESVAPELVPKLTKYDGAPDVFAVHRIDEQLTKAMDRKVWLPSGGTLVIDRTEAMTVVDVNTGKFTGAGGNLEQTVTKNNLEAAEEIVRQLRLRDIGGIIVIDFIDMVLESNRDLVLRRLTEALARDRTRHQVSEVTSLGLVQLTRKKLGTGLIEAFSTSCTHCGGRGIVLHADPVDSAAPAPPRKAESGNGGGGGGGNSRRSKRSAKKGKAEEVVAPEVARVPAHSAEHPMFKAMAAANGKHEDDDSDEDSEDGIEPDLNEDKVHDAVGEEQSEERVVDPDLDVEFEEAEDSDDDDSDDDDEDDDLDDEDDDSDDDESDDDDEDDDLDDEDDDSDDEDSDDDDSEDEDEDDEVDDDEDEDEDEDDEVDDDEDEDEDVLEPVVEVIETARPRRRRAAARPAGPPAS